MAAAVAVAVAVAVLDVDEVVAERVNGFPDQVERKSMAPW